MTIYLYIKQHSITGLKYFHKTITERKYYKGSGSYWVKHLKKHGKEHVITLETFKFENQEEATNFALQFSKDNNIVKSKEWANLEEENAIGGHPKGVKGWNKGLTKDDPRVANNLRNFGYKKEHIPWNKGKISPQISEGKYSKKLHYFFHKKYGQEYCTQHELKLKYPKINLGSHLGCIISGKRKTHKGWTILNPPFIV